MYKVIFFIIINLGLLLYKQHHEEDGEHGEEEVEADEEECVGHEVP